MLGGTTTFVLLASISPAGQLCQCRGAFLDDHPAHAALLADIGRVAVNLAAAVRR
jgi:hypothetical protein